MREGEKLHLTDGLGNLHTAAIIAAHKKRTSLRLLESQHTAASANRVSVAISLLKTASRMEWFLEKATEIGVSRIILFQSQRTEKQQVRMDRLQQILVSALLQSQQVWLPVLTGPFPFSTILETTGQDRKFIAHCLDAEKKSLRAAAAANGHQLLLIGPEGDFSKEEIDAALHKGFQPVAIGGTRLRSETAGMVGASLLCVH